MTIFRKIGETLFGPDTSSQEFYDYISTEIARGILDNGMWTRALADSNYDEQKAKARYITIRVKALKDEIASSQRAKSQYASLRQRLVNAYQNNNYKACIDGLPTLAQRGDSWAQYSLATLYANGNGVARDNYRAYFWAHLAELNGYNSNSLKYQIIPRMVSWDIAKAEQEATNFLQSSQSMSIAKR